MFVDCSHDCLTIYTEDSFYCLDYENIEKTMTQTLIDEWKRTQNHTLSRDLFVITGPGSFTNMRVGILAIQSLSFVLDNPPTLYHTDKISLYTALVDQTILPSQGTIFTGQRKKIALRDFPTQTHEMLPYPQCFLDKKDDDGLFFDMMHKEGGSTGCSQAVSYGYDAGSPWILYQQTQTPLKNLFVQTDSLTSFYLS